MNLDKILAIAGKPGLYSLKVQTRTGFVAESFLDGKKITVNLRTNVSLLTEISMYTNTEEKPLADVMRAIAIKEDCGPAISHKEDNGKLVDYFLQILPDYDQDRVYPSDIKKVLNWYNTLQERGLVEKEAPKVENAESIKEQVIAEVAAKKAPAKVAQEPVKEEVKAKKTPSKKAKKD